MGNRLATIDMGQKLKVPLNPNQPTWAKKWAAAVPLSVERRKLGPHLAQCHLGRDLPPYQLLSWPAPRIHA